MKFHIQAKLRLTSKQNPLYSWLSNVAKTKSFVNNSHHSSQIFHFTSSFSTTLFLEKKHVMHKIKILIWMMSTLKVFLALFVGLLICDIISLWIFCYFKNISNIKRRIELLPLDNSCHWHSNGIYSSDVDNWQVLSKVMILFIYI